MADFLTRMTQRTLGLLPVVQPFIESKYASESMDAAIQSGLTLIDPFPGQAIDEPFENWDEEAERVPPVSISQSVAPREARNPTTHVPGVSQSVAPREARNLTTRMRDVSQSIAPHEVHNPTTHMPGVSQSIALSQEQTSTTLLPAQGQSHPLPNTTSLPVNSRDVVLSQPQTSDRQENESFSTAPTASTPPTPEPHPGQVKPSSQSYKLTVDEPLVPAQSEEISQVPRIPHASIQAVPYKSGVEEEHLSPSSVEVTQANIHKRGFAVKEEHLSPSSVESSAYASIQATGHNEESSEREIRYVKNFNSESPTLVSLASTMSANTIGNPAANKRNITNVWRMNTDTETRLVPVQTVDLSSVDSPSLVSGSDLVEPIFPSVYPPVQTGRTATTIAGKRVTARLSESYDSPTIKITIGRIDVRAVTPTPPGPVSPAPLRVQRARPALSLDDYLKQRNGGQQ